MKTHLVVNTVVETNEKQPCVLLGGMFCDQCGLEVLIAVAAVEVRTDPCTYRTKTNNLPLCCLATTTPTTTAITTTTKTTTAALKSLGLNAWKHVCQVSEVINPVAVRYK
jgi:Flp pilus assembly protein TadG